VAQALAVLGGRPMSLLGQSSVFGLIREVGFTPNRVNVG
jgi:hypothetical protein